MADSASELELVDRSGGKLGKPARVLLRINTMERQPEAKEVMVGGPSKFGFDEERVVADVAGLGLEHARIAGVQVYSASQVLDPVWLAEHIEYVLKLAQRLGREIGFKLGVQLTSAAGSACLQTSSEPRAGPRSGRGRDPEVCWVGFGRPSRIAALCSSRAVTWLPRQACS